MFNEPTNEFHGWSARKICREVSRDQVELICRRALNLAADLPRPVNRRYSTAIDISADGLNVSINFSDYQQGGYSYCLELDALLKPSEDQQQLASFGLYPVNLIYEPAEPTAGLNWAAFKFSDTYESNRIIWTTCWQDEQSGVWHLIGCIPETIIQSVLEPLPLVLRSQL